MGSVLLRAFSFALIICIGAFLRNKKIVGPDAGHTAQVLMLNVTLPAAVITNFASLDRMELSMMVLPLLGASLSFGIMLLMMAFLRNASRDDKISYCNVVPGTNIGNFCLPFVQYFFPAAGAVSLCLYDVGNTVFCLGGGHAAICAYAGGKTQEKFQLKKLLKTLFSSFPLDLYLALFVLSLLGIRPPMVLADFAEPIADANAFMAMMMLGLTFHVEAKLVYFKKIFCMLLTRYFVAAVVSLGVWFLLPMDVITREVLIIILFGPVNTVAGAYAAMADGDSGLVSCVTSLSILCSMFTLTGLLLHFGAV